MTYVLRLYIVKGTASSQQALKNLKEIVGTTLKDKYKLEIIDILKHPQLAEDEKILATPLLEKKLPLPIRRIIGDLSNKEKVLLGLDLIYDEKGGK